MRRDRMPVATRTPTRLRRSVTQWRFLCGNRPGPSQHCERLRAMTADPEPLVGDAFGKALLERLEGAGSTIVMERDDAFVDVDASDYFGEVDDDPLWHWIRPRLGRRVLDIGAGAGRGALRLQSQGVDVVALDVSPGCVEVCRRRGVENTFLGTIEELSNAQPERLDSLVALGNNLGLIGSPRAAGAFFDAASAVGTNDVRIVGTMLDPYLTDSAIHLAYHQRNRERGRLAGNITIRVRYQNLATAWFDLLWASPSELNDICAAHGWVLADIERLGVQYAAELHPA